MEKQVGNFLFKETSIKGVYKIDVKKHGDHRGYFMETYKKTDFDEAGLVYNFVPYLLSLDLNTKLSLNEGSISLDTYLPTLETITTDKSSYKYLISTNYSGTDKFFSGFYFENNEYRAYIHKPLTGDPFYQNADLIVDKNNPLYTYYQKLNSVVS